MGRMGEGEETAQAREGAGLVTWATGRRPSWAARGVGREDPVREGGGGFGVLVPREKEGIFPILPCSFEMNLEGNKRRCVAPRPRV